MIEWIEYLLIGLEEMWKNRLFRHAIITLLVIFMLIIFRRCSIVRQSKGSFFAPYHIADGKLYIHNAFVIRKRIIPLKEIKCIRISCFRGRSGGERDICYTSIINKVKQQPLFLEKIRKMIN